MNNFTSLSLQHAVGRTINCTTINSFLNDQTKCRDTMRKKQKHQTPNTETQVPITKSIITERIFRLSIHNEFYRYPRFSMFLLCIDNRLCGYQIQISKYYKNKSKFLKNIEAAKCSKKQPNRTLSKGFLF